MGSRAACPPFYRCSPVKALVTGGILFARLCHPLSPACPSCIFLVMHALEASLVAERMPLVQVQHCVKVQQENTSPRGCVQDASSATTHRTRRTFSRDASSWPLAGLPTAALPAAIHSLAPTVAGNRGLGLEICRLILANAPGSRVFLGCRNIEDGRRVAASLSADGSVTAVHLDVTCEQSIVTAAQSVAADTVRPSQADLTRRGNAHSSRPPCLFRMLTDRAMGIAPMH